MNSVDGRASGTTTRRMLASAQGAIFVWVNHHLDYPTRLAKHLGREDLRIVSPDWIADRRWVGMSYTGITLDPDTRFTTEREWNGYREAWINRKKP